MQLRCKGSEDLRLLPTAKQDNESIAVVALLITLFGLVAIGAWFQFSGRFNTLITVIKAIDGSGDRVEELKRKRLEFEASKAAKKLEEFNQCLGGV